MAKALDQPPGRMTVERFLEWAAAQRTDRRFELDAGEIVAMAPERVAHARLKAEIWRALSDAIRARGLDCTALLDGPGVEVDDQSLFIPDVVVQCGGDLSPDDMLVRTPVIAVEVLSPSTTGVDTGRKLEGYFLLPSLVHYLVFRTDRPTVIHHRRTDGEDIATRIVTEGALDLDPPGLRLDLDRLYG